MYLGCIWNFEESHLTIRSERNNSQSSCAPSTVVRPSVVSNVYRRNTAVQPGGHRSQDSLFDTTTASKLDD
jgi:hypothetical protein